MQPTLAVAPPIIAAIRVVEVAEVRVLQGETVSGPAVTDVNIGPSASIEQASLWQLYPDVAERPASISIAGGPGLIPHDEPYAAQ